MIVEFVLLFQFSILNKINDADLKTEIDEIDWTRLYEMEDIDGMVSYFTSLLNVFDRLIFLAIISINKKKAPP